MNKIALQIKNFEEISLFHTLRHFCENVYKLANHGAKPRLGILEYNNDPGVFYPSLNSNYMRYINMMNRSGSIIECEGMVSWIVWSKSSHPNGVVSKGSTSLPLLFSYCRLDKWCGAVQRLVLIGNSPWHYSLLLCAIPMVWLVFVWQRISCCRLPDP